MATSAMLFALMNFLARLATTTASWASVAAVRALIGALVAFGIARLRGRSIAANDHRAIFWRSLLGTISMLLTFYTLSSRAVSLGNTVTLLNLSPVFLAALAPIFLRERTTPLTALALAVALAGVVLVVRPSFLFGAAPTSSVVALTGPSETATTLLAITAAFSTASAMMLLRRVGQTESPEAIAFHFSLFATAILGPIALFDLRMPSPRDAACMIGAGVSAGFGQLAMTRAYALENAARVGGMSYLAVVASTVLGALVLGERPGPTGIVGMTLVICGGVLVTYGRRPEKKC